MTDLHWFPGMGFRPAVHVNDYIGPRMDCPAIIPAPDADVAYLGGKFDAYAHLPASAYTWGTVLPPIPAAQVTAPALAGPVASAPFTAGPLIPGPWWPPVDYPCRCITPDSPDMPPIAPVPVPASAGLLIAAVAVLFIIRRFK